MWTINETTPKDMTLKELLAYWRLPKGLVYTLRSQKQILVNGEYHHLQTLLTKGQVVSLNFSAQDFASRNSNYSPDVSRQLQILFENRDLVVIDKPAGIKSHPNQKNETGTVMNYLTSQLGHAFMVHRLDQETSGAMIVAKNPLVVPVLNQFIAQKQIKRNYLAVVSGHFKSTKGTFKQPIGLDPQNPNLRAVNGLNSQNACSHYQVLATNANYSLVYLTLETGRTHQLRVHLQANGHPILGDPLYGQEVHAHMFLHGLHQGLILPFSFERKNIFAPPPAYFSEAFPQMTELDWTKLYGNSGIIIEENAL